MLVEVNYIRNVDMGITASRNFIEAHNNIIENFSGDGMRILGSHIVFEGNTIMNYYDVCDNHDDGIKSFVTGDGVFRNNVIRSNIILNYIDPNQNLTSTLQGIGSFDGFVEDWGIENNMISLNQWHGIP